MTSESDITAYINWIQSFSLTAEIRHIWELLKPMKTSATIHCWGWPRPLRHFGNYILCNLLVVWSVCLNLPRIIRFFALPTTSASAVTTTHTWNVQYGIVGLQGFPFCGNNWTISYMRVASTTSTMRYYVHAIYIREALPNKRCIGHGICTGLVSSHRFRLLCEHKRSTKHRNTFHSFFSNQFSWLPCGAPSLEVHTSIPAAVNAPPLASGDTASGTPILSFTIVYTAIIILTWAMPAAQ